MLKVNSATRKGGKKKSEKTDRNNDTDQIQKDSNEGKLEVTVRRTNRKRGKSVEEGSDKIETGSKQATKRTRKDKRLQGVKSQGQEHSLTDSSLLPKAGSSEMKHMGSGQSSGSRNVARDKVKSGESKKGKNSIHALVEEKEELLEDSSETSDSEIDSESDSEPESDESSVISSGLTVEEILGLKMNRQPDMKVENVKAGNSKDMVYEKKFNVCELLNLHSGASDSDSNGRNSLNTSMLECEIEHPETKINFGKSQNAFVIETSPTNIESNPLEKDGQDRNGDGSRPEVDIDYSAKGGYVKEESNCTNEAVNSKNEISNISKNEISDKQMIGIDESHCKVARLDNEENGDLCAENVPENYTTPDQDEQSVNKNRISMYASRDANIDDVKETHESPKKTRTRPKRNTKKDDHKSIYTENPLQPIVKGVPWADTRSKRKTHGPKSKGSGKGSLAKRPVEICVKNDVKTKTSAKTFGCVNLSESDSD